MKKVLCIILSFCFFTNLIAQEQQQIIEKNLSLTKTQKLDLDLKFAEYILVETWNKPEVNFKAIILYNEDGVEKIHKLDVDETENWLSIATDYDFDKYKSNGINCYDNYNHYHNKNIYCIKVRYELMVPKDSKVRVETISGNIEVKDFQGELKAKSISGFVDVALPSNHGTRLKFRSVTGEIYTDFEVELDGNSSAYSKKLTTEINGGGDKLLSLETVSGDIFFRKI